MRVTGETRHLSRDRTCGGPQSLQLADYRSFAPAGSQPHRRTSPSSGLADLAGRTSCRDRGLNAGRACYGLFKVGTSRVVLDLAAPAEVVQVYTWRPRDGRPLRLLIEPSSPADGRRSSGQPQPRPAPSPRSVESRIGLATLLGAEHRRRKAATG